MTGDSPCLGDLLTALVDGELGHSAREKALAHLTGCSACRADVEDQRRLKARLAALHVDPPSAELSSRLLALSVPGVEPTARASGRVRPVTVRPVTVRVRRGPAGTTRPPTRPNRRSGVRRMRRAGAVGGSLVLAGLAAALVLGGSTAGGASTPIDPGADVFVVKHVSTTGGLPLHEPVGATSVPPR